MPIKRKRYILPPIVLLSGLFLWALGEPNTFLSTSNPKNDIAQYRKQNALAAGSQPSHTSSTRQELAARYQVMNLPDSLEGKTVLDLGCHLRDLCVDLAKRGASRVVGIQLEPELAEIAARYAELSLNEKNKIEYYYVDLSQGVEELRSAIGDERFDYVFCLGIWEAIDHKPIWNVINHYAKGTCYFEGQKLDRRYNNQSRPFMERELMANLTGEEIEFVGYTEDEPEQQRPTFRIQWNLKEQAL